MRENKTATTARDVVDRASDVAGKKKSHKVRNVLIVGVLAAATTAAVKFLRPGPVTDTTDPAGSSTPSMPPPAPRTLIDEPAQPEPAAPAPKHAEPDPVVDFGAGSHAALPDGSQPVGFAIKGNADSMLYHLPGSAFYERTTAEVWFDTEGSAQAAGFQLPPSQRKKSAEADQK